MKRTFYLLFSLIGLALIGVTNRGHAQSAIHGTTQIHSGGHIGVFNSLSFVSGAVVTPRNEPTASILWTAGATHSGASNSSHVNGYAEKAGTDAFMFPVGDGTKLRMAGMSAPASAGNYRTAYFATSPASTTLPSGSPFPLTNLGSGVTGVSATEFWDVDGSGAINLTLTWDSGSSVSALTGGDLSRLVIVGYNATTSKWESLGRAGGVTGTMSTTGTVTASSVTPSTYSAFTFGSFGPLPNLPTFDAITLPSNATAVVGVSPTGGTQPYSYSICGTTPANSGTATVSSTGQVTFIPAPSFTGSLSVCLSVCDSGNPQNCNTTTIPFQVTGNGGNGIGTPSPVNSYTVIVPGNPSGVTSNTLTGSGGTAPYSYNIVSCQTGASATTSNQGGAVTINSSTGVFSYTAPAGFSGVDYFCVRVCDSGNPQSCSTTTIGVNVPAASGILISSKAFLFGPYNSGSGLMTTNLRNNNLIPTADPYGKGATTTASVIGNSSPTGNNAIVDWVLIELRSSTSTIVESRAALLQSDGDIVSTDGVSPVSFTTTAGSYYVSVRHRNHLGIMTATALPLTATATAIDFTSLATNTLGSNAGRVVGSVRTMWAGNAVSTATELVRYSGPSNDPAGISSRVTQGGAPITTTIFNVYSAADLDLNGNVRFSGPSNDLSVISNSITNHPSNPTKAITYSVAQTF